MKNNNINKVQSLGKLSYLLDKSVKIPIIGYRVGIDSIIGIIPGVGDVAGAAISSYIVYKGYKMDVPKKVLAKMVFNIGLETAIGSIPVVGDIFDVIWKSNIKNVELIKKNVNISKDVDTP